MKRVARAGALLAAGLAVASLVTAIRIQDATGVERTSPLAHFEPLEPLDLDAAPPPQHAQYFEMELERPIRLASDQPRPAHSDPGPGVVHVGEPATPTRVRIPAINVDAPVVELGLRRDGTLDVPWDFEVTGWYTGRATPGDAGPSVVVGHFDSKSGPAVFYDLRELQPGAIIHVDRSDGLVAYFRVAEAMVVAKDAFPTDDVYGPSGEPALRLITCSGRFDHHRGSYPGNLVVFAEHLGNHAAPSQAR